MASSTALNCCKSSSRRETVAESDCLSCFDEPPDDDDEGVCCSGCCGGVNASCDTGDDELIDFEVNLGERPTLILSESSSSSTINSGSTSLSRPPLSFAVILLSFFKFECFSIIIFNEKQK